MTGSKAVKSIQLAQIMVWPSPGIGFKVCKWDFDFGVGLNIVWIFIIAIIQFFCLWLWVNVIVFQVGMVLTAGRKCLLVARISYPINRQQLVNMNKQMV